MPNPPSRLAAFLAELRRRRVFRVAVAYAGVAFIVIQIIDGAFDYLKIPEWVGSLIIIMLAVGFPIAVGMAWAFDLTAEGLVRAKVKREPTAAKAPHHIIIGNKTLALVAVLAIIAAAWSWWGRPSSDEEAIAEPLLGAKSIAVLPFLNISQTEEEEIFCDGITDDILTHLCKIGDMNVIARTSSMQYKGTDKRPREIGQELGVATLLEGSVRRYGNKVRIVAQLVEARTGKHLWADDYDRDLTDIFAIQSDVASQIAAALKATLTPEEKGYIEEKPTDSPESYDYYLQGNALFYRIWLGYGYKEPLEAAIPMYEKAVELDPEFALAWARLARAHLRRYRPSADGDYTPERRARAKRALDRALVLMPGHPEVLMAQGYYYYSGYNDYPLARKYFLQAVEKAPNNSEILTTMGIVLRRLGEWEESLQYLKQAHQLDPRHVDGYINLALSLSRMRRWEELQTLLNLYMQLRPEDRRSVWWSWRMRTALALTGDIRKMREILEQGKSYGIDLRGSEINLNRYEGNYEKALEIYSSYDSLSAAQHLGLANLYTLIGRSRQAAAHYDSARIKYEKRIREAPDASGTHANLGIAYAGLGRREEAIREGKLAVDIIPLSRDTFTGFAPIEKLAIIYTMLGEQDAAIDQLEVLLSIPSEISVPLLKIDPQWDPLREHPRFKGLVSGY